MCTGPLSATPGLGQRNLCLVIDQPGIGARERLWADIVLLHMGEPIALECRDACVNQGSQSNIAGFRDQHRAQTCRQVAHSTLALTDMCELREKARSHM